MNIKTKCIALVVLAIEMSSPFVAFGKTLTPTIEAKPTFEETYLVATAYYSPLPGQAYYLKGDYDSEVKLNGNGTHGASGKPVFEGMIAAPKNYAFGTKIWIEGLGVGSVEDRGGAIVNKGVRGHDYDRVDIWMGSWEEGLARALAWGKRTVKARIHTDPSVKIAFDTDRLSRAKLSKSVAKAVKEVAAGKSETGTGSKTTLSKKQTLDELDEKIAYFEKQRAALRVRLGIPTAAASNATTAAGKATKTTASNATVEQVRYLQESLKELGYLKSKSTGQIGPSTRAAIIQFQLDQKIISGKKDKQAGVLTPETGTILINTILYKGKF